MAFSEVKYAWQSGVKLLVEKFVTARPRSNGDDKRIIFKIWKEQMIWFLENRDVMGFVNGEIMAPEEKESELQYKLWRRTDNLVKGWILGSVGKDVLHQLLDCETARDVWLQLLEKNFKQEDDEEEGKTDEVYRRYRPLRDAVILDDWETTSNFFRDINDLSTTIITSTSETVLHIALMRRSSKLVNKLVEIMPPDALALKNINGETALHIAAIVGNKAAASALVTKNPKLLHMLGDNSWLPLFKAIINFPKETPHKTILLHGPFFFMGQKGVKLLNAIIDSEYVDIVVYLAHKYPNWTLRLDEDGDSTLSIIAGIDTLFPRTDAFTQWKKFFYHLWKKLAYMIWHVIAILGNNLACHRYSNSLLVNVPVSKVKEPREKKSTRAQALQLAKHLCNKIATLHGNEALTIFKKSIHLATIYGISELVEMIIDKYPMVIYYRDPNTGKDVFSTGKDVFSLEVTYRFEDVINRVYNMNDHKYKFCSSTDHQDNNLLYICGELIPYGCNTNCSVLRIWPNHAEETPLMLFTKEHNKLKEAGERWMKDTAYACTIAATLIATVMFATTFIVPGGIEPLSGKPLLSNKPSFILFAVSDAISLFTSITSLLMYLSILTSRYAEDDFLYVLPKRLSMGLLSLSVSMLVAFSAMLFLVL